MGWNNRQAVSPTYFAEQPCKDDCRRTIPLFQLSTPEKESSTGLQFSALPDKELLEHQDR